MQIDTDKRLELNMIFGHDKDLRVRGDGNRTHTRERNTRPQSLHGFTLIELLVVVAIIVALIAILLPAMNRSIELAQRAVCLSNLHQLYNASLTYAADSAGHFPYRGPNSDPGTHTWFRTGTTDNRSRWVGYIGNYTIEDGSDVLYCPSNPYPFAAGAGENRWPHGTRYQAGYNFFANIKANGGTWRPGRNVMTTVSSLKTGDQLWGDLAEDKTVPNGSWRLINHPRPDGAHEWSTVPPLGTQTAAADGSARWYDHDTETELASYHPSGITGEWWGKRQ